MRMHSIGNRVSQAQYGTGTVTATNEYHTTIDFDAHGPRTFATSRVALVASDSPAPPKPVKARAKRTLKVSAKATPKAVAV